MEKTQVPKGKEEVIKFGKDFGEQWKVLTADEKKVFLSIFWLIRHWRNADMSKVLQLV